MTSYRQLGLLVGFALLVAAMPGWSRLTAFAPAPDWARLKDYQLTITRAAFVDQINKLYAPDGGFWEYAVLLEDRVIFFADAGRTTPVGTLWFAPDADSLRPVPRLYSGPQTRGAVDAAQPLKGLTICLDPGHVGGAWAKQEERWFQLEGDPPIEEAALNLIVCRHLEPLLARAGARVVWTKETLEPVTRVTPEEAEQEAFRTYFGATGWGSLNPGGIMEILRRRAVLLTSQTAEIRARAERVARLQPDLTLCIHYNAASWAQPKREYLVDEDRLVVFVHGTYAREELAYEDERFDLVRKALEQSAGVEQRLAEKVATRMALQFGLPPEKYENWTAVRHAGANPYVFARNLIANRLYPGPVVFVEGPYMNAKRSYARLAAGDYEDEKDIDGHRLRSIHRDYAEAICQGVMDYFQPSSHD